MRQRDVTNDQKPAGNARYASLQRCGLCPDNVVAGIPRAGPGSVWKMLE